MNTETTSTMTPIWRRLKSGCLFFILLAFCFIIGLGLVTALLSQLGGESTDVIEQSVGDFDTESSAVAVISLSGVMLRGSDGVSEGITSDLLLMLQRAQDDPKIKGLLLRLNTPGGSVTDADLAYHAIKGLEKSGKPVLLLMDETCASGGYYAALAAREIWSLPTSVTGSIGVIVSSLNFAKLLNEHGVVDQSITSGPNKALLSPTVEPTEAHQLILQGIVDQLYDRFLGLLIQSRSIEKDDAKRLADGRIFTAQEALKVKLIDRIGYPEEALSRLKNMSGLPERSRVVKYHVPRGFFSRFSSSFAHRWLSSNEEETMNLALSPPKAYYLYAPQGMLWRALRLLTLP